MKVFLLALTVFANATMSGQIINPEFDHWVMIQIGQPYEDPLGWTTNNMTDENGFASTPVTRGADSTGFHARVASKAHGIDATLSGILSQTISASHLVEIDFDCRCDTLAMAGRCVVQFLDQTKHKILYQDTTYSMSNQFSHSIIPFEPAWAMDNDSITIQFIAKGGIDPWDEQEDGYSVFIIDNVYAEYVTGISAPKNELLGIMYPNPADDIIHFITDGNGPPPTVQIFNMLGQLVHVTDSADQVEVDWLLNGAYIFNLVSGQSRQSMRMVIHR